MFNILDHMVQLLAYNQLLMAHLSTIQDEPLDLSIRKENDKNETDQFAFNNNVNNIDNNQGSSSEEKSVETPPLVDVSVASNNPFNLTVNSKNLDSPPLTDTSFDDSNGSNCLNVSSELSFLRSGKPLLWHFLYQLLENRQFIDIIAWIDRSEGHFQIKQPNLLAKIWGKCKANPNMTYECLSRSLRSYYQKGIITKKSRLQYQFSNKALLSLQNREFAILKE